MVQIMKRVLIITVILLLALSHTLQGQTPETLFDDDIRHGGYWAPVYGATSINGQFAYLRGSRWAWVINFRGEHSVNLGMGRYRTYTSFDPVDWNIQDVEEPDLKTRYRGFELEYVNQTYRLFHFSAHTLVGSGTVRYDNGADELDKTSDQYFVLQPAASLNLNVTRWFRLTGSAAYRYVGDLNLEGTSGSDLGGFLGFVGLRFGKF